MSDPYEILGVRRGDSEEAIHSAYRKLAKRHHPDLNQGKPEAAERFKAINAAHDLLSDTEKRARFDRGEIDAEGRETAAAHGFQPRGRPRGARAAASAGGFDNGFSPDDLESIFGAFGARTGGFRGRGSDVQYAMTVDFLDAALGAVKRLSLPDERTLDVTIPAGLKDGHVLRLKGQGEPGIGAGMPRGDALVEITVAPHKLFRREGDDILLELPVTLQEAVLGAAVDVPTIKGSVRVTVPPHSDTGTKLRLRGRGIKGGNQVVTLRVVLPPQPEPELEAFLRNWSPAGRFDPRAGFEEASGHGGGT